MQDYVIRLRSIHQQLEQLNHVDGQLPVLSDPQLIRVLDYASNTVPEFDQCWNDIRIWVDTMTTFLEQYHTLASQLLEEEDTIKLPAFPSKIVPETNNS